MKSKRFEELFAFAIIQYPKTMYYTQAFNDFDLPIHLLGMKIKYEIWFSDPSIRGFVSSGRKYTNFEDVLFAFVEQDIL